MPPGNPPGMPLGNPPGIPPGNPPGIPPGHPLEDDCSSFLAFSYAAYRKAPLCQ